MPFNIGAPELILVLVVVLILFGPGKLPEVGQALGRTVREFRHASNELDVNSQPAHATAAPATAEAAAKTESDSAGI